MIINNVNKMLRFAVDSIYVYVCVYVCVYVKQNANKKQNIQIQLNKTQIQTKHHFKQNTIT